MDAKRVLWENVRALMIDRYGEENLYRLHKESGLSLGGLSRIKEQKTAVGLDVLTKVATFFELMPWQMLVPNLDPRNPPVFAITEAEKKLYERMQSFRAMVKDIAMDN